MIGGRHQHRYDFRAGGGILRNCGHPRDQVGDLRRIFMSEPKTFRVGADRGLNVLWILGNVISEIADRGQSNSRRSCCHDGQRCNGLRWIGTDG